MSNMSNLEIGLMVVSPIWWLAYKAYQKSARDGADEDPKPHTLADVSVSSTTEGAVIPIVYGKVKTSANIIWYGNLESEEIEEEIGGKGGGDSQVTGFKYYLDVWQAICMGKTAFVETWVNDVKQDLSLASFNWNDGTGGYYPTEPGEFANKMAGLTHVFLKRWYIGDNTVAIPTVHYVITRDLSHIPLSDVSIDYGANPAAVIYDLLLLAGVEDDPVAIDPTSFNAAAAIYKDRKYGINIAFTNQQRAEAMIETVLNFVGGYIYIHEDGRFALRAVDENDTPVSSLSQEHFKEFMLQRGTYDDVPNDFRANFLDEDLSWTQRTVTADNLAVVSLTERKNIQTVDLTCFRKVDAASRRVFELMKRNSYPRALCEFSTSSAFELLKVGDVVSISHSDYGLVNMPFRIIEINYPEISDNEVKFRAEEQIEKLYDAEYMNGGGSSWTPIDTELEQLTHIAAFELPHNSYTEDRPAFLLLPSREKAIETDYAVYYSESGMDYQFKGVFTGWSQHGELVEEYGNGDFIEIDDSVGILYEPFLEYPVFQTVSREQLFGGGRVAICGNEMMAFEKVTYAGDNIRLKGVIRGVLNTPVETHAIGSPIYLTTIRANVLEMPSSLPSSFYLKIVPRFAGKTTDLGGATALACSFVRKAATPGDVQRIEAVRSGSNVIFNVWAILRSGGSGYYSDNTQLTNSEPPFSINGDLIVDLEGTLYTQIAGEFVMTFSGEKTIQIANRINEILGDFKSIVVGAADGIYIS